jgi:hypothetical protein
MVLNLQIPNLYMKTGNNALTLIIPAKIIY